jgi:hypothetical protein
MRSQLLVAGILIALMGGAFYILEVPLVFFWSLPFLAGGGLMAIASLFLPERTGEIEPPEGYRFCRFCSNPVPLTAERCPRCNGLQPKEVG